MIRAVSLTLAAALCLAATAPESRLEQYFRLRKEAGAAAQANDVAKAESLLEEALALYPHSPGSLIRLARVEVAADKPAEAVAHLKAYADLDLTWDIAGDKALSTLVDRPDFAPVAARLTANAEPIGDLKVLTDIDAPDQVVEGLVWRGGGWFVSSVSGRNILSVGDPTPYPTSGGPVGAIFGMALQAEDRDTFIWATEADGPGIPGSTAPPATALLKINFKSGELLARYPVAEDGKRHQLGDVVVTPTGDVIVSDSVGANLYRLKKGAKGLELLLASKELGSPQGIATCDNDGLLIADYSTGLHRLDLKTKRLETVGGKPVALAGTDGLIRIKDWKARSEYWTHGYVVTQNGVTPARVLRLELSEDCRRITGVETLAANRPELADITLAAQLLGGVAFIGGSGWAGVDGDGKPVAGAPKSTPRVYYVPF